MLDILIVTLFRKVSMGAAKDYSSFKSGCLITVGPPYFKLNASIIKNYYKKMHTNDIFFNRTLESS